MTILEYIFKKETLACISDTFKMQREIETMIMSATEGVLTDSLYVIYDSLTDSAIIVQNKNGKRTVEWMFPEDWCNNIKQR